MLPETLGVIGLRGVGGPIAWCAVRSAGVRVVAYDPHMRDAVAAVKAGAVTELAHDAPGVVARADFVVLAGSAHDARGHLEELAGVIRERGIYCTDVSDVKRPVVARAHDLGLASLFAGSHPFVDVSPERFTANLDCLNGALVYVTPAAGGEQAAAEVSDFWSRTLGAHPVTLEAGQHDAVISRTSHLPQAVAAALAVALGAEGPSGVTYGSTALDVTRRAGEGTDRWVDVLLANRDNVLAALQGFTTSVDRLRRALEENDRADMEAWLAAAARWRARYHP